MRLQTFLEVRMVVSSALFNTCSRLLRPSVQFRGTGTFFAIMQPMRRWSVAAKEGMKMPILSALMFLTESAMRSVTMRDLA